MIVPGITYVVPVVAMAVFLWRVFGKRFDALDARLERVDERFEKVDARLGAIEVGVATLGGQFGGLRDRFGTLEGKVDGLAADHQRLSSELAEFRGEMHDRLGVLAPPAADA